MVKLGSRGSLLCMTKVPHRTLLHILNYFLAKLPLRYELRARTNASWLKRDFIFPVEMEAFAKLISIMNSDDHGW